MKIKCIHLAVGLLLLVCPAVTPAGPQGEESIYYQKRTQFIGYPPYSLSRKDRSTLSSTGDLRQAWRIIAYAYDDITPAEALKKAKEFKDRGFNLVLSEGNRYLFRDQKPLKSSGIRVRPYENVIRNTKTMAEACHKVGLKFFLHLTSTMVDAGLIEDHPEWAAIDIATGKTITNGYGTGNSCINNDDFMNAFYARLERLIRETGPDGIMQDEIQFFSPTLCGCRWCREKFKKETGYEIPQKTDGWLYHFVDNPGYQAWLEWRRGKVVQNLQKVRAMIKRPNPDNTVITYLCNNTTSYAYYSAGICIDDFPKYTDSVGLECEPHDHNYLYYWPLMITELKYLRDIGENMNTGIWTLFYDRRPGDHTWNWFVAMSQGSRVWWFDADPAATKCWAPLVAWEEKHERVLMNVKSAANIGVLFSLNTRDRNSKSWNGRGWMEGFVSTCYALTDGHVPYRVLVDADLTAATLKQKVKTLILFDTGSISDAGVSAIREFVKEGGIVLAGGDTSLYDQKGGIRKDFGLADVFGFSYEGEYTGQNTLYIPGANEITGEVTGTLKHEYPFYILKSIAPEVKVVGWMRTGDDSNSKRYPGILTRSYGKGRVVYFAGHPAFHYFFHYYNENVIKPGEMWKDGRDIRYGQLLGRAAGFANTELPLVVSNLPRGVVAEVYSHEEKGSGLKGLEVHLANFLGGWVREGKIPPFSDISFPAVKPQLPDPLKPISVSVRAGEVKKVYLLSPDFDGVVDLPFAAKDGSCTVTLPDLYRYFILYFSRGDDAEIFRLGGGKVLTAIPPAKKVVVEEQEPLAGKFIPNAAIAFADTPQVQGGRDMGWYKKEPCRLVYGSLSEFQTIKVVLTLNKKIARPVLEIGGMDDNQPYSKAPLEIAVNGKVIFKGNSTYPDQEWAVQAFPVDPMDLRTGENIVEIKNTSAGPAGDIPWFGVSFVRIRAR